MFTTPRLWPNWLPAALLFALTLFWFAVRSFYGIHAPSFGDESGHFLGARAMRAGDKLYRDFIDAHGPLSFMAAQAFGMTFGWKEPLDARWGVVVLAGLAAATIYKSPVLQHTTNRLWGTAMFLGLLSAPWLVQSLNMVNYHVFGGILITVILATLVIPAWCDETITGRDAFIAGFCLPLLCADAYSLAPTAILLTICAGIALWQRPGTVTSMKYVTRRAATGFAAGAVVTLVWMLRFADLTGYLAFHVISNQQNYSRYSSYGWKVTLQSLIASPAPGALVQSGAAIMFLSSLVLLALSRLALLRARPVTRVSSLALLFTAVAMTNFRGGFGFQDGTFLVASIAMLALTLPMLLASNRASATRVWIGSVLLGLLMCGFEVADRAATMSAFGMTRKEFVSLPKGNLKVDYDKPVYRRIRSILKPDERLLVLIYDPDFYLRAGFLPFRKYHEFLPWEADYARHPWFGRNRDICVDVSANPPPVIVYAYWVVWNRYAPGTFMACIPKILARDYVADSIPHVFIRRDRFKSTASP